MDITIEEAIQMILELISSIVVVGLLLLTVLAGYVISILLRLF